jgi:hypothetical protein
MGVFAFFSVCGEPEEGLDLWAGAYNLLMLFFYNNT